MDLGPHGNSLGETCYHSLCRSLSCSPPPPTTVHFLLLLLLLHLLPQTDVCGIKWSVLRSSAALSSSPGEPLEDPILLTFSRCLEAGLLAVWRRVPRRHLVEYSFDPAGNQVSDNLKPLLLLPIKYPPPSNLSSSLQPHLQSSSTSNSL